MKVLLVCQYFPPETGGPPNRMLSFVDGLSKAGHDVTVVTAKPNHPEGIVWPEYRGRWRQHRTLRGSSVSYVAVYATRRKSAWARIANYLSFMLSGSVAGLLARGPFDVVLASSPPLFVGIAGWLSARRHRVPLVLDVRDLWPDAAVALGELRGSWLPALATRLEQFLYGRAAGIVAATEGFCEILRGRAPRGTPIALVRNGTVPELYTARRDIAKLRERLGLTDRFVVAYIGNLGLAQGLDHLLDAAQQLAHKAPRMRLLLVGEGPRRARLEDRAQMLGLTNVVFHPRVDQVTAVALMQASDALIVSLLDHSVLDSFIPSKLYDCFASGRPVLVGARGEAQRLVESESAGWTYPNENSTALVEAILTILNEPAEAARRAERARAIAHERYSRAQQAETLVESLVQWTQLSKTPRTRRTSSTKRKPADSIHTIAGVDRESAARSASQGARRRV